MLRRFLGESDEEPKQETPVESPVEDTELPEEGGDAMPPMDDVPAEASTDGAPEATDSEDPSKISPVAQELVTAWESGGHADVAQRLMYTPISYVDFVQMCFAIGIESGKELATLLDQLAEGGDVEGAFGSRAGEKPQDLVKQMTEPSAPEEEPSAEVPAENPEEKL